ncbi:putative membrane protein YfcA [Micromonospora profundi]|uniref:sulfite exporter TauE/SafE family protein n=1 Tax=Micromonospora profundi TaxID=1420889 RepID=UPI00143AD0F6|nr:sulfite exporter TauE/SafE family protein [Micromonospora profundi]NJC12975.1 putative membrane protein YfcA [Micromonospora profundi]
MTGLIPDASLLIPVAAVVLVSSAVQSATGFGFSIVAVPFLAVLLGVRDGVVVNLVLSMIANAAVTVRVRQHSSVPLVRTMAFGSIFGLVPGMLVLYNADVRMLKIAIAVLVTIVAVILLTGARFRLPQRRATSVATGVASGFLAGSVGLGGPPLTVYLAGLDLGKVRYRATMSTYFTVLNIVLVPAQVVVSGLFRIVLWSLLLLPAVVVGGWLGERLFVRLGESVFIRVVTLVVLVAGLGGLLTTGI